MQVGYPYGAYTHQLEFFLINLGNIISLTPKYALSLWIYTCRATEQLKQSRAAAFLKKSNDFQKVFITWQNNLKMESLLMTSFLIHVYDMMAAKAQKALLQEKRLPLTPKTAWHVCREVNSLADAMWTLSNGGQSTSPSSKSRIPAHDEQQSLQTQFNHLMSEKCVSDADELEKLAAGMSHVSRGKIVKHREMAILEWKKQVCCLQRIPATIMLPNGHHKAV
jgi:hypothetical protein